MTRLLSGLEQGALFILVFGLVVAFHELGHFLVAKAFRVRVALFSIGFGPRLLGRTWGETEYRIAAIPLGGYVSWTGEPGEEPTGPRHPRDYEAQSVPARLAIMAAGPFFSALLGVIIMWIAFMAGVRIPAYLKEPPRIGAVQPGSPAESAGLKPGDLVVTAGRREVSDWEAFSEVVLTSPGSRLDLGIDRAGERLTVPVDVGVTGKHRIGTIGADPCAGVLVRAVTPGSPAEAAGFLPGDRIAAIAGQEPCGSDGLVALVQSTAGGPLAVTLERGGATLDVTLSPRRDETANAWLMGVGPELQTTVERYGPGRALVESVRYCADKAALVAEVIGKLLTGRLSIRSMSGPLEMASMTQATARIGFGPFIELIALITVNVAVFNLLPVPILDGGRILLLAIEAVRGRDLERRTKEWILQAGLAMMVVLTMVVLVVDAIKRWEG